VSRIDKVLREVLNTFFTLVGIFLRERTEKYSGHAQGTGLRLQQYLRHDLYMGIASAVGRGIYGFVPLGLTDTIRGRGHHVMDIAPRGQT